jgi:glycosyltransferase involved in cell wall biosynthesis
VHMASTLDGLLRDPALEQALRSNARARAEQYHLDAIAERYARMLSEYLA